MAQMMKENSEKYGMAYSGRAPYEVLKTNWVSFDDILKLKKWRPLLRYITIVFSLKIQ